MVWEEVEVMGSKFQVFQLVQGGGGGKENGKEEGRRLCKIGESGRQLGLEKNTHFHFIQCEFSYFLRYWGYM